jgi:hypothetical protein
VSAIVGLRPQRNAVAVAVPDLVRHARQAEELQRGAEIPGSLFVIHMAEHELASDQLRKLAEDLLTGHILSTKWI